MRYMGLDFGDKNIGVAVSDESGSVALAIETVRRADPSALRASVRRIEAIVKQYGVEEIVLGYPKKMDNSESERCGVTKEFKAKLERTVKRVPVILWDERLSTMAVSRTFNGKRERYGERVDAMAAVYILQGYLDYINKKELKTMEEEFNNGSNIVMFDDEGNEVNFQVLSAQESGGFTYLLVEEILELDEAGENEELSSDVLFFKCIATDEEEMTFELVEDDHEDFEMLMDLFKEDFKTLEIEIEE